MIEIVEVSKIFFLRKTLLETIACPWGKNKTVPALNRISLRVEKGQIFALLGPNGAGKSTLIKMLCSLILPDRGKIKIAGYDLKTQEARARSKISLVTGEERSLYWRLTGRQNLEFFGAMYNLTKAEIKQRINRINQTLEIDDLDKPFENYSTGMKQRVGLARGLISNPEIIFMDEPTRSMDPSSANNFRIFIKERLAGELKKTVFFATHQTEEAEELADKIAIISKGKIKACGNIAESNLKFGLKKNARLKELYLKIIS